MESSRETPGTDAPSSAPRYVSPVTEPRRMLVVCTANLCRSPVAEALLRRRLADLVDVDGRRWTVASAGTDRYLGSTEPDTVAAAAALGLDIAAHSSRQVSADDLATADLILTMTRSHVRSVVAADKSAWPRTFTVKELVRRAIQLPPPNEGGFAAWLADAGTGRRAADLLRPSADDDVVDPYRRGRAANFTMVNELDLLIGELLTWGPWQALESHAPQ